MSESSKYKHHAHILPLKLYLGIGAALIFMTIITVAIAQIHLGPFNLVIALLVAVIKATLVGLFFMHLIWDNKLYALIFVAAVAFLGIFITITLFDTMRRGDIYQDAAYPIKPDAIIYKEVGKPILQNPHEAVKHDSLIAEPKEH